MNWRKAMSKGGGPPQDLRSISSTTTVSAYKKSSKMGRASSIGSLLESCKKLPMLVAVISDESDVWPRARLPKLARSTFYTQTLQNIPDSITLATGFSGSDCGRGASRWNGLPALESYSSKHLARRLWRSSAFQAAIQVFRFGISQEQVARSQHQFLELSQA